VGVPLPQDSWPIRLKDLNTMPPPSPLFSFGIYPFDGLAMPDLVRIVKAGEEAGFDIVHFPEHLLPPPAFHDVVHNRTWWDLPALCSFLAGHTSRIRFFF